MALLRGYGQRKLSVMLNMRIMYVSSLFIAKKSEIGKSVHHKAIVLDKYLYIFIQECPGGREPVELLTDLEKTGSRSCLWHRLI